MARNQDSPLGGALSGHEPMDSSLTMAPLRLSCPVCPAVGALPDHVGEPAYLLLGNLPGQAVWGAVKGDRGRQPEQPLAFCSA